jgi:hypothetical protein
MNFTASVAYGVAALVLMALAFHMTGDDFGVALVAITAALAWASCYCTALYEQTAAKGFATAGVGLTGWALVVGLFAVARLLLS